jgi:CRISPR/Cas system-associated protein Cas10 (large subunit of type III CRISPR-Cas system)
MREIPKKKMEELRKEVEKEFPESYGLQQVHLARLIIEEKTKDLTVRERIQYYRDMAKK